MSSERASIKSDCNSSDSIEELSRSFIQDSWFYQTSDTFEIISYKLKHPIAVSITRFTKCSINWVIQTKRTSIELSRTFSMRNYLFCKSSIQSNLAIELRREFFLSLFKSSLKFIKHTEKIAFLPSRLFSVESTGSFFLSIERILLNLCWCPVVRRWRQIERKN